MQTIKFDDQQIFEHAYRNTFSNIRPIKVLVLGLFWLQLKLCCTNIKWTKYNYIIQTLVHMHV